MQPELSPSLRPAPAFEIALGTDVPFRRRLLLAAVLAGILLVCVAGALAWHQYDDARQGAVDDATTRVALAGQIIDTYFGGELTTLDSMAQSPTAVDGDLPAMNTFFRRVEPKIGGPFAGGVAWIDAHGLVRVSTNGVTPGSERDVADRTYFRTVMNTGEPYVSKPIVGRTTHRRVIVMAVPTHDEYGLISGVLTGAFPVSSLAVGGGSLGLGFTGLSVLDRSGAVLGGDGSPARNASLVTELQRSKVGLLTDARGLDGSSGHLVAYATASIPGWTIVIDRSRSSIFAAARHALLLELALIAAAATVVFCLIGWLLTRARREADRQTARTRQRDDLAHALGAASFATEVARELALGLAAAFPDALAIVALESDERHGLELAAAEGPGLANGIVRELVGAQSTTYATGIPFAVEDEDGMRRDLPELHAALRGSAKALYSAPLRRGSARPIGALCLLFAAERSLDDRECAHVAWFAEEAAQALDRARSFEHEHAVAVSLQRSLLSQELPKIEGVELLGRYQAGSAGLEVGGDWYDVVRRCDGIVHITVGDVAGRGVTAAVLMGQMRNAFRAYAYDHTSPAEVLRRMRRHITGEEMATAVCLTLDPYTQELTYASAGHPPSLLRTGSDGAVTRLDGAGAPPLGFAQAETIHEAAVSLSSDSTLVAYTDGLIEHRGWSIDRGIDMLADVLGASAGMHAETLAKRIVQDVAVRVGSGDDIALLVVRLVGVPERMEIEIPSDPAALAGLRRRLRTWLELRGLNDEERHDAVLSISEACNNAIEHGYNGRPGVIRLALEHHRGQLGITIEDQGDWRPPTPSPERGRGIQIMRTVMHHAQIEHAPGGTRVTLVRRLAGAV